MASRLPSASTRKKAQVILSCQLCQRSSPLKWKCMDCDILMCDNCKANVHSKVKTAKIHKIADIKDVDFNQPKEPSVDLDNIPCKTHPTQSCCVYCVQCKQLICPKCLTKTHKGHDVEEIETQYNENLDYLRKNIADNIDPHDLTAIFGSFDKLSINYNPEKINLKKINTFETNLPFIHILVTTSVNSIWIACHKTTSLQEMQIAKESKIIREFNMFNDKTIYDLTISKTGDLLFTLAADSHLYRLDKTGKMNIVHDFGPLLPKAVYVNNDNIFVSSREKGEPWPLTEHSRRQIVVLDQTGKQKVSVIEYDKQNTRLFSLIFRMKMDKTGNIVAIDSSSINIKRIVKVVNNSIQWIYEGNPDINTDKIPFRPLGLSITKMGNIIVADGDTHSLHILSEEGVAIKCCLMAEINILLPHCLDIDSNGNLWIGCDVYLDSGDDAKIHTLEITGC